MAATRIDKESLKQERMMKLLVLLLSARKPMPLSEFRDQSIWGSETTFQKMRNEMNLIWERLRGTKLIESVDAQGFPTSSGTRYLALADKNFSDEMTMVSHSHLLALTAGQEFLRIAKGTVLADHWEDLKLKIAKKVDGSTKNLLLHSQKKFFYLGKGIKDYSRKRDVMQPIYEAILQERIIEVKVRKNGNLKLYDLKPLGLVMYNSGLYLATQLAKQNPLAKPYLWRVEVFESAVCTQKKFVYPPNFRMEQYFRNGFGLFVGEEGPQNIVLALDDNAAVQHYIQDRRWSSDDRYEQMPDGRLKFKFKSNDLSEVMPFVLGLGRHVEVLEPAELRADVAEHLREAALRYGG